MGLRHHERQSFLLQPFGRNLAILFFALNADALTPEALRCYHVAR